MHPDEIWSITLFEAPESIKEFAAPEPWLDGGGATLTRVERVGILLFPLTPEGKADGCL